LGLNEAQGQTLISQSEAFDVMPETIVRLANPLVSTWTFCDRVCCRIDHSLQHNVSRKNYDLALFEIDAFSICKMARQKKNAASRLLLTGQRAQNFWSGEERDAKFDIFDLKGIIEEFLQQFGLRGAQIAPWNVGSEIFLEIATIAHGKISA